MKKKCILFAFLFVTVTISSMAQQDQTLKNLLQNKTRLDEIMPVIKNYYKDPSTISKLGLEQMDRQLKQWQRWEWYMSSRLGPDGEFVNINQKMTEATGLQQKRNLTTINKTESTTSVAGNWLALGPLNTTGGIGRADRLAFHPNNANIVYAGTSAGGLWRTTDAGLNWTNLTPDISSAGISGIAIDPLNTNNIYILTGDGDSNIGGLVDDYGYMRLSIGVLKSTDGGNNWKRMGDFPGADYSTLVGYRLVIHPGFNYIIYACTSQGLYWSVNSGETWTLLKGGSRFFNLEFRPGSGSVFYATGAANNFSRSYFWRSTTSGFTMDTSNLINNQINNPTRRAELAVAPANPDLVYLLAGGVPGNIPSNPVPNQFKGLLLSNDGGLTFNLQSNTPNILGRSSTGTDTVQQSNYDLAAAVSNISSSTIVAGGVQMWRSLNSGTSWAYRGSGLHDDIHDLGFHPADNKLWAATDGGVYSSTDNGTTWISHFQDMNTTQFYRMAVSPTNYLDMIGGAQDNSVKRRTGATSFFDDIACCDGFAVGYDNVNSNILYAITNQSVNRSIDGGNNFNSITPPNTSNPFSMSMAVHTSLGNALFVGSDSVWRTTNGGANWAVTSFIQGGWFMRTCPSNGNRVYAAGGSSYRSSSGSLRRSDDGGVNWFAFILSGYPSFPDNYPKITCINVNPTNSANVWVTFGGFNEDVKVYYSNDAGVTWFDRTGSLPNVPVNCIALDNNNNAYIGTDNGVYYRSTSMSDWIPFYNNLPYVPVTELIISETEGFIRASTFGRGIWSSTLRSSCVADLNLIGTLEGQEFYEASNRITSTAFLDTSEGTKVQMRGGAEVNLQPGFSAQETTQFRAIIGPCGSGGVAGFRIINDSTLLFPQKYLRPPGKIKALLHIKPGNKDLETIINVMEAGEIYSVLTDGEGNRIRQWDKTFFQKGEIEKKWLKGLAGISHGLYYLHLLHNDEWQHMQEIEVK